MKAFTVNFQDRPGYKILPGIKLVHYKYKNTNATGIRLGYFTPRPEDKQFTPKFFNVKTDESVDLHQPVDEIGIVKTRDTNFYGIANFEPKDVNPDVFLFVDLHRSGRIENSIDKFRKGELSEGKVWCPDCNKKHNQLNDIGNNTSVRTYVNHPTVVILKPNETITVKYFNFHKHALYIASISHNEKYLEINEYPVNNPSNIVKIAFVRLDKTLELNPPRFKKHSNNRCSIPLLKEDKLKSKVKELQNKFNSL